jgi:hypothetical protein
VGEEKVWDRTTSLVRGVSIKDVGTVAGSIEVNGLKWVRGQMFNVAK